MFGQTPVKIDFRRDVQPIFKAHCHECHGASLQMNGFRLDRRHDAMKGGTLPMIGPGNAAGSRLYLKLIGSQYGPQMPPTGPLQPEQIELIEAWIDQGAEWPDAVSGEAPATQPDPGAARLMHALRDGDSPLFRKTLAADPKAARRKGPKGATPLMYAGLYGDISAMRLLLDKDADPNTRNDAGATALMWVVDDIEKTRLLVEHGADVNERLKNGKSGPGLYNKVGATPFLMAAGTADAAFMRVLVELVAILSEEHVELTGLETEEPNLERVFLHLTGRALRD